MEGGRIFIERTELHQTFFTNMCTGMKYRKEYRLKGNNVEIEKELSMEGGILEEEKLR